MPEITQMPREVQEHMRSNHPLTGPVTLITSFHAMVERLATPRYLKKVTQTR